MMRYEEALKELADNEVDLLGVLDIAGRAEPRAQRVAHREPAR